MKQFPKSKSIWSVLWAIIKAKISGNTSKKIYFLKCDKKGCLHTEFHDEIILELVGKPCPVCGSELLTVQEFVDFEK